MQALGRCNRRGFTVVELLTVFSIIVALFGLALPAIQSVREAARAAVCGNHLRQVGIAMLAFENTQGYLAGSWFNADPTTTGYTEDRGLFVQLLPHIEWETEDALLEASGTTLAINHSAVLRVTPAVFLCPSANDPTVLTECASRFSGAGIAGLRISTADYIGNGGYVATGVVGDGPIGVQMGGRRIGKKRVADIMDGMAYTIGFWESVGSRVVAETGELFDVNSYATPAFQLTVIGPPREVFSSVGIASTKSYVHSWAGLRIGNMVDLGGSVINAGNRFGRPMSFHPKGARFVFLDGHVRFLSEDVDRGVAFGLASYRGFEAALEE